MAERHLGPYKIIDKIGAGGMATVFKALDPRSQVNRMVAVKVLRTQFTDHDKLRERFLHEARVAANLENLLQTTSPGDSSGYVVYEDHMMAQQAVDENL